MVTEIIETGRTVDEAINSACHKLGHELEHCDFEIIDFPKKGFLGLKNIPAKVRVYLKEEVIKAQAPKEAPAVQQAPQPVAAARQPQLEREVKKPRQPEQRPAMVQQPKAKETGESGESKAANPVMVVSDEMKAKATVAAAYLEGVFRQLSLSDFTIEQLWEESGVCLSVQGDSLGAVIGRRGETLDALQYLSGLVANRMEGDYLRITVDCGEYRVKRKATLEALAQRVAEQVLKTDVSKTLEPMNPFERRIIHATVSNIEGVSSTSVGEEPNRRVVITSPTAKSSRKSGGRSDRGRSERSGGGERSERRSSGNGRGRDRDRDRDNGKGGDRRRSGGGSNGSGASGGKGLREGVRGDRKPPAAYQPARDPDLPPSEAADQPLYGKIDLE